ncbi:ATPase [Paenibacillus apiarius]|uniref:ATPase n=1 Tax=Paenibacillus apiarius TaxID=46240 RepID=A0ABT4DNZ6_9BACL|nr:ATPase [Paenibacillus apiarius]MBN3525383.1 ATPase [Paenibacillus apiarius]MCY9512769.1 ATPase [Paenibacillus apiarius]MCY9519087.1 ATPase [Paenibacillus apiarius]MCY9554711.1 ATPase [Paenibacillus apiarius]MCY9559670.1 ATPase [Paenibacillus apiarius]
MLHLGEKVVIVADRFEQHLPIGEYGYIIAHDRNADNAFDYVIRVPKANRNFFVPASDVEQEDLLLQQEADRIEREALIDYALATRNESLFRRIMNGDNAEEEEEKAQEALSQEEFVRQVNLRAWI